ncbi:MAG TPA: trypsin-like peptidase domain-containing protein [Myxococcales bacterium]
MALRWLPSLPAVFFVALLPTAAAFAAAAGTGAAPLWEEGVQHTKASSEAAASKEGRDHAEKATTLPDFTRLAEHAMGAVVSISTLEQKEPSDDPIKGLLDPHKGEAQKGLGSGFFVNAQGYIVTNAHVVEGASQVKVTVRVDGHHREYPVRVVGFDRATDVALLKIEAQDGEAFPTLPLGNSDELQVAEWVAAVGNPYGLSHSVTVGVVSYKGRTDVAPAGHDGYYDYIQTDASINPGNSGGPLLNARGEVIGIANAVNAVGQGIGFAVPINMAKQVLGELLDEGRVRRSWLGVTVEDLTPEVARDLDLPPSLAGVLVSAVVEGGPGAGAGLRSGDVITEFNGVAVDDAQRLRWLAATAGIGKTVSLAWQHSGHASKGSARLAAMPEAEPTTKGPQPIALGLLVREVDVPKARKENLALPLGACVREVKPDSPAQKAGLKEGDVILKVNDQNIEAPGGLNRALSRVESGGFARLVLRRNGETLFLAMKKP